MKIPILTINDEPSIGWPTISIENLDTMAKPMPEEDPRIALILTMVQSQNVLISQMHYRICTPWYIRFMNWLKRSF